MITTTPFSASLAAELAAREARDQAAMAERQAQGMFVLRQARPVVINREVDVLTRFEGDDGIAWVKVPARRDILL